jgi:hypothetical protein
MELPAALGAVDLAARQESGIVDLKPHSHETGIGIDYSSPLSVLQIAAADARDRCSIITIRLGRRP